MKTALIAVVAFASTSVSMYHPPDIIRGRCDDRLTIYQVAELVTGVPANLLRAIAIVESDECDWAVGDQGRSLGRFQINETFRAERVKKWGEYDPRNPGQAAILAGRIYMENLSRLGDETMAICSYRQGVQGVIDHGPTEWYSDRVGKYYDRLPALPRLRENLLF